MEVIVTSGGTIARIDDVRHIGNFSEGTTGARIAEEFLRRGTGVHFVYNKKSRRPFRQDLVIDANRPLEEEFGRTRAVYEEFQRHVSRLHEVPFETFEEYYEAVKNLLTTLPADAIILAAAVSDYGTRPREGKIRSDMDEMRIDLVKYPKVIALVKQWQPRVFQVGFKLLSRVTREELIESAYQHGIQNRSDLTVANALLEGDFRKRMPVIITPEKELIPVSMGELPVRLVDLVCQRVT